MRFYLNRMILIGNGFDLAHCLKTSYKDFIDDFWNKKTALLKEIFRKRSILVAGSSDPLVETQSGYIYNDNEIKINIGNLGNFPRFGQIPQSSSGYNGFYSFISGFLVSENKNNFQFNNLFLEKITLKSQLQNWVDIEEEYYSALIDCQKNKGDIKKLNDDFSFIQIALQIYLSEQKLNKIEESKTIRHYFFSDFIKDDFIQSPSAEKADKILFLNFNYTSTLRPYTDGTRDTKVINIHGELQNINNRIIFGYGDEIDDNYKLIEKENNNEYLKYIKAFNYSKTNNYRDMLNFINTDEYQIFIMGLSCGTSDRTLLNTIFEHKNCKSIKIFYYKENAHVDNYLDIYMNISRNFTNKQKMRELVVSLENSLPLT